MPDDWAVSKPLHGQRFPQPIFRLFVAQWRREREPLRRQRLSLQAQRAYGASNFEALLPAVKIVIDGKEMARLNDGTVMELGDLA